MVCPPRVRVIGRVMVYPPRICVMDLIGSPRVWLKEGFSIRPPRIGFEKGSPRVWFNGRFWAKSPRVWFREEVLGKSPSKVNRCV